MNFDYPKMLYRFPATGQSSLTLEGAAFDTATVESADDEAAATAEGWCTTWPAARKVHDDAQAAAKAQADADAAAAQAADAKALPTRAEMEQKATELGIKFDGRTSDKKLSDQIAAALEP